MRALLPIAATLALAAAGCGGSDSNSSDNNDNGGGGSAAPAATSPGGASANAIEIKNFAFNPASATVKVGQKVTWTNKDSAAHNVISDDGTLKSSTLQTGDSYSFTPKKAGTISYVCTFHPNMKATLTVTG
jgi:plastocyanin